MAHAAKKKRSYLHKSRRNFLKNRRFQQKTFRPKNGILLTIKNFFHPKISEFLPPFPNTFFLPPDENQVKTNKEKRKIH